jgi:hypothetical protein
MSIEESEFVNQLLLDFFERIRNVSAAIFVLLIAWIVVTGWIIDFLRRVLGDRVVTIFFLFGGVMHSYWHIFVARLLGYNVRHVFIVVWGQNDISAISFTLSDGRTPGKIRDAFLIGYAPIMNLLLIYALVIFRPMIRDNLIEAVPPIDRIWWFIIVNLSLVGLPDINDLILPIESLFVNYPFFAFECIWGFFFGVFLYSNLDSLFVTFLLFIYSLAVLYTESGSSFLTRREKRILEPWEEFIDRVDT